MAETAAGAWNKLQAERDEFSVCIKKLTQQLADSDLSHTEKDKAIKSLTDRVLELERVRGVLEKLSERLHLMGVWGLESEARAALRGD